MTGSRRRRTQLIHHPVNIDPKCGEGKNSELSRAVEWGGGDYDLQDSVAINLRNQSSSSCRMTCERWELGNWASEVGSGGGMSRLQARAMLNLKLGEKRRIDVAWRQCRSSARTFTRSPGRGGNMANQVATIVVALHNTVEPVRPLVSMNVPPRRHAAGYKFSRLISCEVAAGRDYGRVSHVPFPNLVPCRYA
ncbi:hypothetical protein J6590_081495 [Homalodisca vitripennis]|nr:hypothetical protein J6590_081495 [Homalodisca vitripennis]